jgi:hypothetical protein
VDWVRLKAYRKFTCSVADLLDRRNWENSKPTQLGSISAGFRVFYEQIHTNSVLAVTSVVAGLEFSTSAAAGDDAESPWAAEDSV